MRGRDRFDATLRCTWDHSSTPARRCAGAL
jgi:hypothetical protein